MPSSDRTFRLYGYRWVVLGAFSLVNLTIQTLWIAYAPITGPAASFYGVSDLKIGLLAMSFMIAFVPLSLPVSWVIDTYGFRFAANIGAVMMAVFGLARGFAGASYSVVLWSTIGLAVAQPFFLNAWTRLAAQWFALEERATAVGVITLASLVGTAVGMAATPWLTESMSIPTVQLIYGAAGAAASLVFFALARERPPTPPCPPGHDTRALMIDGLKHALRIKAFWIYLLVTFIGMGTFNAVTTWIENIVRPRGFTPTDAGTFGAIMLVGGLLGAVIIPYFSDRQRKRQIYLLGGMTLGIPGLAGIAFAQSFTLLALSSAVLGFFLVSTLPIGMQYAAEITHPTPEGTSNGLIQLFGQGAVVFVYLMEAMKSADGSFSRSLWFAISMLAVGAALTTQLKDRKPSGDS